jgi:hypothetical protein
LEVRRIELNFLSQLSVFVSNTKAVPGLLQRRFVTYAALLRWAPPGTLDCLADIFHSISPAPTATLDA